jgi:outer membrane immunogenic protein
MGSFLGMKKFLLVTTAFGMLAMPAMAADMNAAPMYKAPIPVAVAPAWTGLYLGFNGGWGWAHSSISETAYGTTGIADISATSVSPSAQGGVFGGQIGYNYQFLPNWVVGVEGDYDAASITDTKATTFPSLLAPGNSNGFAVSEKIQSLASIRGRIGYTWGPGLLYFTGGGAWADVNTNATISANTGAGPFGDTANASNTNTKSGFVIGGGLEWMVAPNWTVRGEYLYYDFSNGNNANGLGLPNCAGGACGVNVSSASNNISVFRLGANYKFDLFR